jgi:hypothetical protein
MLDYAQMGLGRWPKNSANKSTCKFLKAELGLISYARKMNLETMFEQLVLVYLFIQLYCCCRESRYIRQDLSQRSWL